MQRIHKEIVGQIKNANQRVAVYHNKKRKNGP